MPYNFKTEKILAWIGNILSILSSLLGMLFVIAMTKLPEVKDQYMAEYLKYPSTTQEEAVNSYNLIVMYMQGVLIVGIILLILALVGTFMLKKSKASGIILIIVAILKVILTFGTGIITSILWLIAGIKRVMYKEEKYRDNNNDDLPPVENLKDPYEYQ